MDELVRKARTISQFWQHCDGFFDFWDAFVPWDNSKVDHQNVFSGWRACMQIEGGKKTFTANLFVEGLEGPIEGNEIPIQHWAAVKADFEGFRVVFEERMGFKFEGNLDPFMEPLSEEDIQRICQLSDVRLSVSELDEERESM